MSKRLRLDLGIVLWIVRLKQCNALAVDCAKARCRIGDLLTDDRRDEPGEHRNTNAAQRARFEATFFAKTCANHHVGLAVDNRVDDFAHLTRRVLSVGVDLDSDVVAVIPRVLVSRLYGAADTKIER